MADKKMPKVYVIFWAVVSAAYALWMILMKNTILVRFESVEERTVELFKGENVLFDDITGMIGRHWLYPIWVIVSTLCLLLFIVYIKKILYGDVNSRGVKYFCLINLVFAFVFVTWYALMGDRYQLIQKVQNVTASMLGLDFPWHFRMWGIFSSMSVFTNVIYAFKKHDYNSRLAVILGSIGSAAIFITINLPSVGEAADFSNPRCLFHWTGALLFAFSSAAPLAMLLFAKMREHRAHYKMSFFIFIAMALIMTVLLVVVGKSALIENIPVWAAYVFMFMLNFTSFYNDKVIDRQKEKVNA